MCGFYMRHDVMAMGLVDVLSSQKVGSRNHLDRIDLLPIYFNPNRAAPVFSIRDEFVP